MEGGGVGGLGKMGAGLASARAQTGDQNQQRRRCGAELRWTGPRGAHQRASAHADFFVVISSFGCFNGKVVRGLFTVDRLIWLFSVKLCPHKWRNGPQFKKQ